MPVETAKKVNEERRERERLPRSFVAAATLLEAGDIGFFTVAEATFGSHYPLVCGIALTRFNPETLKPLNLTNHLAAREKKGKREEKIEINSPDIFRRELTITLSQEERAFIPARGDDFTIPPVIFIRIPNIDLHRIRTKWKWS